MASSESSYYSSDYSGDFWYNHHEVADSVAHLKSDELPDPDKDSGAVLLGEFTAPVKVQ